MNKKNATIKKSVNNICKRAKKNPTTAAICIGGAALSAVGNVVCGGIWIKKIIDRKKEANTQVTPLQLPGPTPANPTAPMTPAVPAAPATPAAPAAPAAQAAVDPNAAANTNAAKS